MGFRRIAVVTFGSVILVVAVGLLCYLQWTHWNNKRQIELARDSLRSDLNILRKNEPSAWRKYIIRSSEKTLTRLEGKTSLEGAHIVLAYLGPSPLGGREVQLDVGWFETSFQSRGISLRFAQNGASKVAELTFPDDVWNKKARKRYKSVPWRGFTFYGRIEEDKVVLRVNRKRTSRVLDAFSTVALPSCILSEPVAVTLYDDGNHSTPVGLFVHEEVRALMSGAAN